MKLATCSYRGFDPSMGVPVRTSLGKHPQFSDVPECDTLKPRGVFRVLDHLPLAEQAAAYQHRLTGRQDALWTELRDIETSYPGLPLVLLCWCHLPTAGPNGCHRRWAAAWFQEHHHMPVPELTAGPA